MLGAYGWAFVKPIRKLYYNLTITSVSVIVAFAVGGIEALGLIASQLHLTGQFWSLIARLNNNFGVLGYFIIGLFALAWILSVAHLPLAPPRRFRSSSRASHPGPRPHRTRLAVCQYLSCVRILSSPV